MKSTYHDKTGRFFTIRKYDNEWIFVSQWTGEVSAMTLRGFIETIKSLFVILQEEKYYVWYEL